jgi:hypothetical protein
MLTDAADANLPGFRHVGSKAKKWSFKNVHRNLLKHCLRDSAWPPLFYSPLDVFDRKTGKITSRPHPFLLPHEVVCALWKQNGQLDSLRPTEEKHPHFFAHVQKTAQSSGMPADQCIVLGLHGDGVPFGTQGDSVENLTFNFPACDQKRVRILFTTIPKRWAAKGKSMAGALHVLAWSLLHLALGVHPATQPNGQPFKEKFRRKLAGTPLPCRGPLAEVRADWQWLKQCLHIPAWNEISGICFLCKASLDNYKDLSDSAPWRSQPLSPAAFHHAAALQGAPVCPLSHLPGCDVGIVSLDWLHNCDSGVCADLAGNALLEVVDSYGHGNRKARCAAAWQLLQDLYRQHNVKDRMDELKPELFLQPKKAPKLRCKAAVTRALAPLLPQLLQLAWPAPSPRQRVVLAAATSMAECYAVLSNWNPGKLGHHSRTCAKLLVSRLRHSCFSLALANGGSSRSCMLGWSCVPGWLVPKGTPATTGSTQTKVWEESRETSASCEEDITQPSGLQKTSCTGFRGNSNCLCCESLRPLRGSKSLLHEGWKALQGGLKSPAEPC